MEAQRTRARSASKFGVDYNDAIVVDGITRFTGYDQRVQHAGESRICGGASCSCGGKYCCGGVGRDPFYGESGGQVGDKGLIRWEGGEFLVKDTQKEGENHLHFGELASGSWPLVNKWKLS